MVQVRKILAGVVGMVLVGAPVVPAESTQPAVAQAAARESRQAVAEESQPAAQEAQQAAQQQSTPQQQTLPQQKSAVPASAIPDAPRPQALPDLHGITAVAPAVPDAPAAGEAPASDGQTAPGRTLPSSTGVDAAPVLPGPGQGAKVSAELESDVPPPPPGPGVSSLRVNVYYVEVPFTVKDSKGQLVPGLTWRDVRVYENGLRQQMKLFAVDPFPLTVAFVIDQSVTQDVMERINNALGALQGAFTPYDEVSVFTYNNGVKRQTVATAAQSARLAAILERSKAKGRETDMNLGGPLAQGPTRNGQTIPTAENGGFSNPTTATTYPRREYHTLNDAILSAAQETTHAAKGRRRIVYVISDGKEYGSTAKQKDVIKYCQTNKVSVWATVVGDSSIKGFGFLDRIHLPLEMRDDVLPTYAAATGGQVDPEFRQKGIEESFAKITDEVRNQYTIGYYSHEPVLDGKYRKIEVRVARPNLTVIAKEGYYPTLSDTRPTPTPASATP